MSGHVRSLLLRLVAVVVGLLSTGCGALHGVGDEACELRAGAASPLTGPPLRRAILARLAAARVAADVSVDDRVVRVVVDRATLPTVRALLRWPGGVTLAAPAPTDAPAPLPVSAVEVRAAAPPPAGTRFGIEPTSPDEARLRVVRAPPLVVLEAAALTKVEVSPDGQAIDLRVTAERRADVDRALDAGGELLVMRDDAVLGALARTSDPGRYRVRVGEGLYAYARADRVRALLATPALPELETKATTAVAADYRAFALGLALPVALSLLWLAFVRRFDRLHPEPLWLVLSVFGLGLLSVVPAALIEVAWARASIALNPTFATMGGRLAALPYALAVFTLVVGVTEEGVKLLAASFVRRRREFDEPIDGIVYGVAAALGFAAAENVKYFATGRLAPSLVLARTFTSIPAHLFFGAIWGFALGQTLVPGRGRFLVLRAFLVASLLHGAFDALLSTKGLAPAALVLNLALATTFVVLVRRALRRGAVDRDAAPLSRDRSTLVTVGSPALFWLAAVGVHAAALAALVLGADLEAGGARAGLSFGAAAAAVFAVLIASAWALSATLPLDVVLDADGVTFAGSTRRWERISGVGRADRGPLRYLRIESPDGALDVGPLRASDATGLAALFASRGRPPA